MCQLLETIKCKNGELVNLPFHQSRFDLARKENLGITENLNLTEIIKVPDAYKTGLFRCRVVYAETIEKVEFLPHEYRKIHSLRLIEDNTINYGYKFADRKYLEFLFEKRGNCDDILIVKNDCITDSFTANVVFFDGNRWWTPGTPLLPGTQRAKLLEEGKISVCRITPAELPKYTKAGLINAMQGLEEMPVIEMKQIQKY